MNNLRISHFRFDFLAGFVVFLVALPLSLGIAMASGVPPFAGLLAAVLGGLLVSKLGGAPVAIHGPAAGLIVIVLGAVESLGAGNVELGYRLTLAVIVCAGLLIFIASFAKAGLLSELVPTSVIHGMLSSIGIMIFAKQIHVGLGVTPNGKTPLALLTEIPSSLTQLNPEIAAISVISIVILVGLPLVRWRWVRRIPAPMVVVLVGMALGHAFDLDHQHVYLFREGHPFEVGPKFLVTLPQTFFAGITHPDWSASRTGLFWSWVVTLALVQGLETLLSANATGQFDPLKRPVELNRDLRAVGAVTMVSGMLGGLPMIAEIVRSRANVLNGAKSSWSNFWHGFFILVFVAGAPQLLHQIPLSALAAILMVTGYRLASPSQLGHAIKVGSEQFVFFVATIAIILSTDLVVGVLSGIGLKILWLIVQSKTIRGLLQDPVADIKNTPSGKVIRLKGVLHFGNLVLLKRSLSGCEQHPIEFDFSNCDGIDHTAMAYLNALKNGTESKVAKFDMNGLKSQGRHADSSRWRK